MGSKVICLGLSRSGTSSLHHILSELGLESVHYCDFLLSDSPDWQKCEEFDALGDTPIPCLYKELDERFPNSKFILTIREKGQWLDSMKWMFTHGKMIWSFSKRLHQYHEDFYGTRSYNERILSHHWDTYHHDVLNHFSGREDDLLIIKLEAGFKIKEISSFLGLPFRDIPTVKSNVRRSAKLHHRLKYLFSRIVTLISRR